MGKPMGINVLAHTVNNIGALESWVGKYQPDVMLVMDSPSLAYNFRQISPDTMVIHRVFSPNDTHWEDTTTPAQWIDAHAPFAANGVVLQVYNEPNPASVSKFITWLIELIDLTPNHIMLAICAFAVGNPNEVLIQDGSYDRLIKKLAGSRHWLMLHEYFRNAPIAEAPYLCGRFKYWYDRADKIGVARPKIVIGEHGRDVGGGRNDGWKGMGWTEEEYFDRLKAVRSLYKPYNIATCLYCYGHGYNNDWASFDVEGADWLLEQMGKYTEGDPMPPYIPNPSTGGIVATLTKLPGSYINVREQPSPDGRDVGDLHLNDKVIEYPEFPQNGWIFVEKDTMKGWVSLQNGAVAFTPIDVPVPPSGNIILSPAQYAELKLHNYAITRILKEAGGSG